MSVFLSDVLVFVRCLMKMRQFFVEQESLWACQYNFTTYCEEAPCAQNPTPQETLAGVNVRCLANFSMTTSIHILWYYLDLKAFDILTLKTVWKIFLYTGSVYFAIPKYLFTV